MQIRFNGSYSIKKFPLILAMLFITTVICCPQPSKASDETSDAFRIIFQALNELRENYVEPLDTTVLMQHAVNGMTGYLDPNSKLLTPEEFRVLSEQARGGYGGIGVGLTLDNGFLELTGVVEDGPAHRAGLKTGDRIATINHRPVDSTRLLESADQLRGTPGSRVHLSVIRPGKPAAIECSLTREQVSTTQVKSRMIDPKGFGYLVILQFSNTTADDVVGCLEDLESSHTGLKGLIIDLRNNPGGPLAQAVAVSDLFLEKGNIVTIKGRKPESEKIFKARKNEIRRDYPLVVLMNGGSASSSEIVAGALQDHERAVIAGTRSFGKGSVQTVVPLPEGYALKYTVAKYYTPKGRMIQDKGIVPDVTFSADRPLVEQALDILKKMGTQ